MNELHKYPNKITSNIELENIMKHQKLKHLNFRGVYSIDNIPNLSEMDVLISNNMPSDSVGEHWICLYKSPTGDKYIFDSYGRNSDEFKGGYKDVYRFNKKEYDLQHKNKIQFQQRISDNDCGYRCIIFIKMLDKYGDELLII